MSNNEKFHPVVEEWVRQETRRQFLSRGMNVLGMAAMSALGGAAFADGIGKASANGKALPFLGAVPPPFAPKAKRVIYLHMVGGPPQMDLYDYKPKMVEMYDKDLPESVRNGQRLTTMTSGQTRFPIAPSKYKFAQYGKSGMWVSELLPHTASMVDDMCFIRSMNTDAINHEPAITFMQTGNQITGRPCLGSWVSYGLGSLNEQGSADLRRPRRQADQHRADAGDLRQAAGVRRLSCPACMQGVSFRSSSGDPILYINNPPGVNAQVRRETLDGLKVRSMR